MIGDADSLFFWDSNSNSGVRKFRTPDSRLWPQKNDSDSGLKIRLPHLTLGLTARNTNCVLQDDSREILNSSNKRCTIVYKQTSSSSSVKA